jgi:hypothetical protein
LLWLALIFALIVGTLLLRVLVCLTLLTLPALLSFLLATLAVIVPIVVRVIHVGLVGVVVRVLVLFGIARCIGHRGVPFGFCFLMRETKFPHVIAQVLNVWRRSAFLRNAANAAPQLC